MLIDFKVTNFRSIKETQELSMLPVGKVSEYPSHKIHTNNKTELLRSLILYGRNASGKTNLLRAITALYYLVKTSAEHKIGEEIDPYEPFRLDKKYSNKPVGIEIKFLGKNSIKYLYSIEYTKTEIITENLFYYPNNQKVKLFTRNVKKGVETGILLKDSITNLINKLYKNQLLLSKVGTDKVPELIQPYLYLTKYLYVHNNLSDVFIDQFEINDLAKKYIEEKDNNFKNNLKNLIKFADFGIDDLIAIERNAKDFKLPKTISKKEQQKVISDYKYELKFSHSLFDNGKRIGKEDFKLGDESNGTKKFLVVNNLILDALSDGSTIIIDELDKSLHPLLTRLIIYLFNSPEININNAQLIFATHDVSLLDPKIFRRDQIWFVDKDSNGKSTIYSLADLRGVRKDINYEKYYMKGVFGAIPLLKYYNMKIEIEPYDSEKI